MIVVILSCTSLILYFSYFLSFFCNHSSFVVSGKIAYVTFVVVLVLGVVVDMVQ